ncbi:hypothetical protein QBC37DRAFT_249706, partial [Rhypophila decipiens]
MPLTGENLRASSLYITLNSRPKKGEYHWGLLITDSSTKGTLHHANNGSGGWKYEARAVDPAKSMTLIALVFVASISDPVSVEAVIRSIPTGTASRRTGEAFTCRIWVKDVLVALQEAGLILLPEDI